MTVIKHRRGTSAQWVAANTVLAEGEFAYEKDTKYWKVGDGITAWIDLPYGVSPAAPTDHGFLIGLGDDDHPQYSLKNSPLNAQTGTTYTFVLTDNDKTVTFNNAAAIAATVPPNSAVAFPLGASIDTAQLGAGQVTFVQGAGVTIRVPSTLGLKIKAQYGEATLTKIGTDEWLLAGFVSA